MATISVAVLAPRCAAESGLRVDAQTLVHLVIQHQKTMGKPLVRFDPRTGRPAPGTVFVDEETAVRWVASYVQIAADTALRVLEKDHG